MVTGAAALAAPLALVNEGLGNSSYLVDLGGGRALAIDPERDPGPYLAAAESRGLTIAFAAAALTCRPLIVSVCPAATVSMKKPGSKLPLRIRLSLPGPTIVTSLSSASPKLKMIVDGWGRSKSMMSPSSAVSTAWLSVSPSRLARMLLVTVMVRAHTGPPQARAIKAPAQARRRRMHCASEVTMSFSIGASG